MDGESEESIIWKDTKFLSVSNNGYQDFVVAKI
nr:MAG TPA: Calcium-activated chloride channel-like protein [Caudoviricetes sp.]DAN63494.1 MAG TPA: Calcium-activated chloride channel-like protein [Caudoviricetes sp.]